jgi:hypothetical protein
MGEFVFGRSFGMLENRKMHHIIKRLQSAISFIGPLMPASWIVHAGLHLLPRFSKVRDWYDSLEWCEQQMQRRLTAATTTQFAPPRDLTYYLIEQEQKKTNIGDSEKDKHLSWLGGDSLLAIIAGRYVSRFIYFSKHRELGISPYIRGKYFVLVRTEFRWSNFE